MMFSKEKSSGQSMSSLLPDRIESPASVMAPHTSQGILRWVVIVFLSLCLLFTIYGAWPSYSDTLKTSPAPIICPQGSAHTQGVLPDLSTSNSTEMPPGVKAVKIMVLTRYRSGSSFVGDLFSHHPDVYYMFEPLQLVSNLKKDEALSAIWLNKIAPFTLERIYRCAFDQIYSSSIQMVGHREHWQRAFCTKDTSYDYDADYEKLCTKPDTYLPTATSNVCHSFKHTVIKTIRLHDGNIIENLTTNSVKVIHLVRDPRGQMSSIVSLQKASFQSLVDVRKRAAGICDDLTKMLDTAERLLEDNPALRDNYLLVRYEDVALNPEVMTERMYQFAGLDLRSEVREWIKNSTVDTSNKKVNAYSTKRNSATVVRAWTQRLSLYQVMAIQEVCEKVLWRLGYGVMWSQADLKNKNPIMEFPQDYFLTQRYLRTES